VWVLFLGRQCFAGRLACPLGYDQSLQSSRPSPYHPGLTEEDEEIIRRVEQVAKKKGAGWKMSHVALIWHKSKRSVPIVGLNSIERIEDMCELKGKSLTDEEVKFFEEPYIPRPVAGHV